MSNQPIDDEPKSGVAEPTPGTGIVEPGSDVQGTTTPEPSQDDVARYKKLLDDGEQQHKRDIANLKSTLQKQISETERRYATQVADITRQLHEARKASLPEEDRTVYDRQVADYEMRQREAQLQQQAMTIQEYQEAQRHIQQFSGLGIDMNGVTPDQGRQAVLIAGWEAVKNIVKERNELRAELDKARKGIGQPKGTATPSNKMQGGVPTQESWQSLSKRPGGLNKVFEEIERGGDSSILPKLTG